MTKYGINGIKVRTSDRTYTHAVVADAPEKGYVVYSCCGSLSLAEKALAAHQRNTSKELRIEPLEVLP